MRITTEQLDELLYEELDKWSVISDNVIDIGRWGLLNELIFKTNDKYYRLKYRVGATEYQEGTEPFDGADSTDATEVVPVPTIVTVYEPKRAANAGTE